MNIRIVLLTIIVITFTGCQSDFYSSDDFQSVLKIDSHVHINSDDGVFEEQAAGDNFNLITLNVDHSDSANIRKQYDYAYASAQKHSGKVFYGPTFYFDTAGWETDGWSNKIIRQLDNDLSSGAVTVKIWKNIGMTVRDRNGKFIMADDPGLDKVIEFIKSKNIPIAGHLGEPRNCWLPLPEMTVSSDSSYFAGNPQYHMFLHPEYPSYQDQINAKDNLLIKHPDLIFIGCHLASLEWNVDSLGARLDRFPNLAVDMSARICHLQLQSAVDRKKVRDFCMKYQDRLLYGTDIGYSGGSNPDRFKAQLHKTWIEDWNYFATDSEMTSDKFRSEFKGLQLPKEVVRKIFSENAIRWYKLKII